MVLELEDKIETLEKQLRSLRGDLYETLLEIKASLPGVLGQAQGEQPDVAVTPPTKQPRKPNARRVKTASKGQKSRSVAEGASASTKRPSDKETEHSASLSESPQLEVEDDREVSGAEDTSHVDKERLEALLEVYASAGILPHAAKDALYHIVTLNEASPPIDGGLSLWDCASVIPELNDAMVRGRKASEILGDVLPDKS